MDNDHSSIKVMAIGCKQIFQRQALFDIDFLQTIILLQNKSRSQLYVE